MAGITGENKKDDIANPNRITVVDGRIVNIANTDLGNADTSYTYIPWASNGFRFGILQLTIEATTVTIEATADPTSVADGDAAWVDVTQALFGVDNITVDSSLIIDVAVLWARFRIKRVTTNATNAFSAKLSRGN